MSEEEDITNARKYFADLLARELDIITYDEASKWCFQIFVDNNKKAQQRILAGAYDKTYRFKKKLAEIQFERD